MTNEQNENQYQARSGNIPNQNDTEFAEENNVTNLNPMQNENMQPEQKSAEQHEVKERGGNHNPEGANQYTVGRHDDRGRKEDNQAHEEKKRGANQYTEGRNDDRGRKE